MGLTDVVYTELLQGFTNETDMPGAERQLLDFDVLRLEGLDDFGNAAMLYRAARREGLTIRRTTECLIAAVCIRESRPLTGCRRSRARRRGGRDAGMDP